MKNIYSKKQFIGFVLFKPTFVTTGWKMSTMMSTKDYESTVRSAFKN